MTPFTVTIIICALGFITGLLLVMAFCLFSMSAAQDRIINHLLSQPRQRKGSRDDA